jgi:probable rRNA maturation factor
MQKSKSRGKVRFHSADATVKFHQKTRLKKFVADLFKKEGTEMESLDYIFCSDDYLLGINKQFLQHNYHTDIITFPLSGKGDPVIGEVYMSIDRIRDNAKEYEVNFIQEFLRVVFHGALHLCGYKDKSASDIKKMRSKEDEYLVEWSKAD